MRIMQQIAHRHLWQRLPRKWRRAGLFRATSVLAPRPTQIARSEPPIFLAGPLRAASGLGEAARLNLEALKVCGTPAFGIDVTASLMQPLDYPDASFVKGKTVEGGGTLILSVNAPLVPLAMWCLGRRAVRNKYVIGYWAWELPDVPREWHCGVPFIHEIWVPTKFVADAVKPIAAGRPVRIVPYPLAIPKRPWRCGDWQERPFTALVIFDMASSFARKNPIAAIMAFRQAFGDDASVRLIVKVANSQVFPVGMELLKKAVGSARNVVLIARTMSAVEIDALYRQSNVLLSLHRSEGFGLTLAEAMLRGLPLVATNWSGNVDFLNSGNGFPIPYRLVPAEDPQGTYHHPSMMWADADVNAAATALRHLHREPGLAQHLGEAGAAYAARAWSAKAYAATVRRHLRS